MSSVRPFQAHVRAPNHPLQCTRRKRRAAERHVGRIL